jgi:hypothetical protein
VFAKYSPKISPDDLRKLYATLTYTHHPTGVDLQEESRSTPTTSAALACSRSPPMPNAWRSMSTPTCWGKTMTTNQSTLDARLAQPAPGPSPHA